MTETTIEGDIPTKHILHILNEANSLACGVKEEALQILLVGVGHLLGELGANNAQVEMDGIQLEVSVDHVEAVPRKSK